MTKNIKQNMKIKLLTFAVLLCATSAWAQTSVSTDSELRTAVQTDGANISLTNDINLSNSTLEITGNRTVTINLNSHKLDRRLTQRGEGGGQVITVRSGATLNLSNGTLKGGWGGHAGGLSNESGTVNLTNVTITGCTGDDNGGGICNLGGTLTMNGGAITNNTCNDHGDPAGGGGLFNAEGATATLTGVTITGNEDMVCGGGGICNFGTLNLNGCTIQDNKARTYGGGIWEEGTLNMSGANTITGNNAADKSDAFHHDLYLYTNRLINVTGSLAGSNIGLDMKEPAVFTSNYTTHNSGIDPATIFHADMDPVMAVTLDGNEAKLGNNLPEGAIYYIDNYYDERYGYEKIVSEVRILNEGEYTLLESGYYEDTDLFLDGTYVVKNVDGRKCHYDGIAYVNGDTKIILCDDSKLEVSGTVQLTKNDITLDIYSQAKRNGVLQTDGDISHWGENMPGIGSGKDVRVDMHFHGGIIKAQGESSGAGIGGGSKDNGDLSSIDFYDVTVEARGGDGGAGIGSSPGGSDKNVYVTIYGGTINAYGGDNSAGIGGGENSPGEFVEVYGGEVYAYGGNDGAGIGGGWDDGGGTLIVSGGLVKAYGGGNAAGIGTGSNMEMTTPNRDGGRVTVYDGEVYAYGGVDAAGIGGGEDADCGTVTIHGGYVYAEGNGDGAGIGGGQDGKGGDVTIDGGTVVAKAGGDQRAIGAGEDNDSHGDLTLADDLGVFVTTDLNRSQKANRVIDCRNFAYVRISHCAHGEATATISNGDRHNMSNCKWCYLTGEILHTFGDYGECPVCHLVGLANDADNSGVIAHWDGATDKYVTLNGRTLKKNGSWNTLCLPFSIASLTGTPLEGATVKTLQSTAFDNGTLTMNFSNSSLTSIEAGKPYIVKWDSGDDVTSPVFKDVTISNVTINVETDYADFTGIYSPKAIAGEDKTMLYLGADNKLYYPDAEMTINAFRAYFQLKGITAGDISNTRLFFGDEATGIVDNIRETISNNHWYTLDGFKLDKKPTAKGVYINNGRKVVIK